ncbi:ankyrin repeat domain-containing protein 10-like isoform X1 [Liolophura sinensis]|uniref:ankyrin repeat domain-containing protein 10-like isoform X1 n=1 Tax=Liolophura sinensis TaxID=3198878 RepID=UPI0031598D42
MGSWGNSSEEILQQQFPLHRACRDGDVQTVAALLGEQNELGPSNGLFQEDTFYGWTPTHWAAYFGKLACLRRVLSYRESKGFPEIDTCTGQFQQTPAHLAAFACHPQCLSWLIQSGADLSCQDYLGETALHKAARTGSMECVSLLVSQGSKLSTLNYNSQTAAQLAVRCGFPECAKYLEKAHKLQQPPRGVFQDLLPPGPLAPALNGTEPYHAPHQQKLAVISQGLNGGIIPPSLLNGSCSGVSRAMEEDAMDTGDTMMTEEAAGGMPYFAEAGEEVIRPRMAMSCLTLGSSIITYLLLGERGAEKK